MSTLLHVILDRAPALATLAQECKGCPGTLCKGCHGTEHEGGCPYAGAAFAAWTGEGARLSTSIFTPSPAWRPVPDRLGALGHRLGGLRCVLRRGRGRWRRRPTARRGRRLFRRGLAWFA